MKKNTETYLPLFSGFYSTLWELDTESVTDESGNYVNFDRIEADYQSYNRDVCEHIIEYLNDELSDFSVRMKYLSIDSPPFYNFSNDICNITVDVDEEAISEYIYKNRISFEDYLALNYTSCDGFYSKHSNEFSDWEENTKQFKDYTENEHILGSLLEFILENEDVTEYQIFCAYDTSVYEYVSINSLKWEDIDLGEAFEKSIDKVDLYYGYTQFIVSEAKQRSELFTTDWKDELSDDIKIELLEHAGLSAEDFDEL